MSRYRPIDTRIWGDRKFLALSDEGRLLWIFLLTSSALPIPGVVVGGDAAISEQLGWSPERFRERFAELFRGGLAVRRDGRVIWLANALKYQPPANPNVIKGWAKCWDDIPESELKRDIWEALKIACKSWSRVFDKLFPEPFVDCSANGLANGLANGFIQDQDQEQEQEQEKKSSATPSAGGPSVGMLALEGAVRRNLGDVGVARARKPKKPNDWTEAERASAKTVLAKLGERNGVEYTGTDEHLRLIINQLRIGRTEMDLRVIVGYCASKWADDEEMLEYLRPETLFGPKTISKYLDPSRAWLKSLPPDRQAQRPAPPNDGEGDAA